MYYPENKINYGEVDEKKMHGDGRIEKLERGPRSPNLRAVHVQFVNGAHTKWHYHSGDQILMPTEGRGFVEYQGLQIVNLLKGDRVLIPADTWHRHGAIEGETLVHLAITTGETTWEDKD